MIKQGSVKYLQEKKNLNKEDRPLKEKKYIKIEKREPAMNKTVKELEGYLLKRLS